MVPKKHKATREFNGSAVPVGSKVGKILINSIDAASIMDAIRRVVNGEDSQPVKISDSTSKELRPLINF
jgi:hypothetical protein